MSEENTETGDAGGSTSDGGSQGQYSDGGGGGEGGGGGGFAFDSWDGNRENLPEEHHTAFDAFQKTRKIEADEKNQRLLAETLNRRYSDQDEKRRSIQARNEAARRAEGDAPLTASQLDSEFRKREMRQQRSSKIQSFRDGMVDIVSSPQQYGDATVTFASNDEVSAFETWMDGMFKGKMTPSDMLKIYRFDQILKANQDAAVRNFEKGLKGRKQSITEGGSNAEIPRSNNKKSKSKDGGPRRIQSLEDFIKSENPSAHHAIMGGKMNPLEHI